MLAGGGDGGGVFEALADGPGGGKAAGGGSPDGVADVSGAGAHGGGERADQFAGGAVGDTIFHIGFVGHAGDVVGGVEAALDEEVVGHDLQIGAV